MANVMKPTAEILERISIQSRNNREEVFTRLYRYMLRPDIYYQAYKNLYANAGAGTNGIDDDTADGFGAEKVARIIEQLRKGSYTPKPVRRTYIPKKNGRLRPLGIPTFTDKLVQEVLRMILEAVYESIFLPTSHGFRPKRSCHTALSAMSKSYRGTRWFVEGDIKAFFDNIDHQILVALISKKVKDARIVQLVNKMLKAGYMEDWQYHGTFSGTPQGGIISPLLANIYLHELDVFMQDMSKHFAKPREQEFTPAYRSALSKVNAIKWRLKNAKDSVEAKLLIKELHAARAIMVKIPCKSQTDKKIVYTRYADDFLIGVNGSKEECVKIKAAIKNFLSEKLRLELSEEKTLITHTAQHARFLGYDVSVRRTGKLKKDKTGRVMRTLNSSVELNIPFADKIERFVLDKQIAAVKQGVLKPICRRKLIRLSDLEILSVYNSELRGICNYYGLASNYTRLSYFAYLMEYSCLKTLASKHQTTTSKIRKRFKDGRGGWCIVYTTRKGEQRTYFAKYQDCKSVAYAADRIPELSLRYWHTSNSLESRLKAKRCEYCGTTDSMRYEIHHVNKLRNLQGKAMWERLMIARRRKTLVLCEECHHKLHHGRL